MKSLVDEKPSFLGLPPVSLQQIQTVKKTEMKESRRPLALVLSIGD